MPETTPAQTLDLNNLVIKSPCTVDWESMTGDERTRYCGQCSRYVYNFAELTNEEAFALIRNAGDRVCGRLYRRADGTVMTKDCEAAGSLPVPGNKRRLQFSIGTLLVLITASAGFCASLPWVGDKISRLVASWSDPPPPPPIPMTMCALGSVIEISPEPELEFADDVVVAGLDSVDVTIWGVDVDDVDASPFE